MKIQFNGAVRNVTGSKHLLQVQERTLLLDCGLYQGRRDEARRRNSRLPFAAQAIHNCVLSHAHVDHSGTLPVLVKSGFKGKIFCTPATADLCAIMLRDSATIQERDAEYLNKHKKRRGDSLIEPLYTLADAEAVDNYFETVPYGQSFSPMSGVTATFFDAGHILGSAITRYDLSENGMTTSLVFTGDLGRNNVPILRNPQNPGHADYLATESTYGNRLHDTEENLSHAFKKHIEEVRARRGVLIIPAFSVGRTQLLLYHLGQLINKKELRSLPIFVDSPLAISATEIYERHTDCYDSRARELLRQHKELFAFNGVKFVRDAKDSMALNHFSDPCIILSASGMCEAGRVLHHLKHRLPDPRNRVLMVGWQAPHTLGRKLIEKEKTVRVLDETVPVKAEIVSLLGFSAHADAQELEDFAASIKGVKRTFLVHGETAAAEALKARLARRGRHEVVITDEEAWYPL